MSQFPSLSRRQVLKGGLAALAAGAALPAAAFAANAAPSPLDPAWTNPPPTLTPAVPRGLAAVTQVLSGVGVYVGNDWFDWDDNARHYAMSKVRGWGFDFICPKVGGYARTWYRDAGHLRSWAESARGIGLGFAPFIYSIPETSAGDAKICAEIANVVGIANVDLEDEWGAHEKGDTPGYKGAQMAEFGRIYRDLAGSRPIIANGYGDPITRFGKGVDGFPNDEMASWADVYSPQWYIGVYSRYHKGGVGSALDWGKDEVTQALGPNFPLLPSVDLSCSYTPDRLFPLPDTLTMMEALRQYHAPIFVWEYNMMTPAYAEALLGPPSVQNVRLGRVRSGSFDVIWDTHVPARSVFMYQQPDGTAKNSAGKALDLTHSEGASKLAPGTAYPVTVQSVSGGGQSPIVPLTVATAPAVPGIYAQSAIAAREPSGHLAVTILVANSAITDTEDVQLTSLSITGGGSVASPSALPYALGAIPARDRTTMAVVLADVPANAKSVTLTLAGTAAGLPNWTATLPIALGQ